MIIESAPNAIRFVKSDDVKSKSVKDGTIIEEYDTLAKYVVIDGVYWSLDNAGEYVEGV